MRLHRCTVAAFGSFGGQETVDFDDLSADGLFLLHGPTGAGKTTILDAISFALFGKVPGDREEGTNLRSHHAQRDVVTSVTLEVTLGVRRFRIFRSPKQSVLKKRGEGLREETSKVELYEIGPDGEVPRAEGTRDVDEFLAELLPMKADQFYQLVMLPQGDFAKFLRARSGDRQVLLQMLFATQRFEALENWLKEQADALGSKVETQERKIRDELRLMADRAEAEEYEGPLQKAGVESWVGPLLEEVRQLGSEASQALQFAESEHRQWRSAAELGAKVADQQAQMAQAEADVAVLEAGREEQVQNIQRLKRAGLAAQLSESLRLFDAITTQREAALQTKEQTKATAELLAPGIGDLPESALAEQVAELDQVLRSLQSAQEAEHQLEVLLQRIDSNQATVATADTTISKARSALEAIPEQRRTATERHQACLSAELEVSKFGPQVERLQAQLDAIAEFERLVELVSAALISAEQQRAVAVSSREAHVELREKQLDGRASWLAQQLVENEPCSVCGSTVHPEPASLSPEAVSDEAVASSERRVAEAQLALTKAESHLASCEASRDAAKAMAGTNSVEVVTAELVAARAAVDAALLAAEPRKECEDALLEIEAREQRAAAALESAQAKLAAARETLAVDLRDRDRIVGELEAQRDQYATISDRVRVLTEQRKAVVELLAAHKRAASLEDQLRSQSALLDSALLERGFVDIAQARTEQPVPGEVEQLNLQVNAFVAQEQRISAVLADPTLIKAAKSPAPDLAMLTQLEVAATERLQAAGIVTNKAQELGAYLEARSAGVEQGIEAIGPLLAEYETTRRLANLCAGRDGSAAQKNRLSTYVLASRLEQVALVASERLLRMSNGRYSLLYTDEAKDGRNRGGLGLKVFDAHTGKERDTTTLSGGESFFASLALALGVADVVTAESGGLAIETLFIDEGFGTLDEDTLNEVMVVLEDLKAGGRRVGIVSHVAELRSRIPKQLEVVALERGSTLRVSAGQQ